MTALIRSSPFAAAQPDGVEGDSERWSRSHHHLQRTRHAAQSGEEGRSAGAGKMAPSSRTAAPELTQSHCRPIRLTTHVIFFACFAARLLICCASTAGRRTQPAAMAHQGIEALISASQSFGQPLRQPHACTRTRSNRRFSSQLSCSRQHVEPERAATAEALHSSLHSSFGGSGCLHAAPTALRLSEVTS